MIENPPTSLFFDIHAMPCMVNCLSLDLNVGILLIDHEQECENKSA